MQREELLFDNLFKQALSEWPESLNLELQTQEFDEVIPTDKGYDLVRYKNLPWDKNFENYVIKGLYDLCESIVEKYYGDPKEIIMASLNHSIHCKIHNLSKYLTHFELIYLRTELIRQTFEKILKEYKDGDWDEGSMQLIKDYFVMNYPEEAPVS